MKKIKITQEMLDWHHSPNNGSIPSLMLHEAIEKAYGEIEKGDLVRCLARSCNRSIDDPTTRIVYFISDGMINNIHIGAKYGGAYLIEDCVKASPAENIVVLPLLKNKGEKNENK